jgi:DNA damage-binding protein 1
LNEKSIIGANADMNIFMFSLQSSTPAILSSTGLYHAADMITKFILRVNMLQASRTPESGDQQLFFTSSGCIGLVTEVDQTLAVQMNALNHELANLVEGKHGRSHTMYRAPKHSRGTNDPASGFLDGDFLEKCLDSPFLRRQLEGCTELGMTENDLEHITEVLQSMHS